MKVLIAGYGNMGKTYAKSFIGSRFIQAKDIFSLEKNTELSIESIFPASNRFTAPNADFGQFDIIIVAVKPQDFKLLAHQIAPWLKNDQLILSIMAGVTLQTLASELPCTKIVRAMPNIPTQLGMGMTVFTASQEVDRKELFIIQNLINTTGKSIYVENESLIDAATAVSGSGPAYVFYFMQAMIDAAVQLGFSDSEAELLVNQTFMGSVAVQNNSSLTNDEWIQKVASKGGTTEQALMQFNQTNLKEAIIKGVHAANRRAKELGQ